MFHFIGDHASQEKKRLARTGGGECRWPTGPSSINTSEAEVETQEKDATPATGVEGSVATASKFKLRIFGASKRPPLRRHNLHLPTHKARLHPLLCYRIANQAATALHTDTAIIPFNPRSGTQTHVIRNKQNKKQTRTHTYIHTYTHTW